MTDIIRGETHSSRWYQRLYDRMAPFYGPAMRLFPMWRSYIEAVWPWLERLPASGAVLEIGPGPGWLLAQLSQRFVLAVGIDLSAGMLDQAQEQLAGEDLPARLVQGNAVAPPFRPHTFDAVVLTFVFSAIPNGVAAMAAIQRVLRPEGLVISVDACIPSDGNPLGVGLAHLWEQFGDFMRDEAHLMRQAGLEVLERREFGAFNSIRLVVGQSG